MESRLRALGERYSQQVALNAKLLNQLRQATGCLQVCCRVRGNPANCLQSVPLEHAHPVQSLGDQEVGVRDRMSGNWRAFNFDWVWGPDASQASVFKVIEPLAVSVTEGYNAALLAYGQTGSGKTHTMIGSDSPNNEGVAYRTVGKIFDVLKTRGERFDDGQYQFSVKVAMVEVYNEELWDLLDNLPDALPTQTSAQSAGQQSVSEAEEPLQKIVVATSAWSLASCVNSNNSPKSPHSPDSRYQKRSVSLPPASTRGRGPPKLCFGVPIGGPQSLDIRHGANGLTEVVGLKFVETCNPEQVVQLLDIGRANRTTSATANNSQSSRSHLVLIMDVTSSGNGDPPTFGRLFMVDLAGSERYSMDDRALENQQLETQHINRSLSALGDVVAALQRKDTYVPYRNSKLTYLLQDALNGNSSTMMIVNIRPEEDYREETTFTLQFATRARQLTLGVAQRNVGVRNLQDELVRVKSELVAFKKKFALTERSLAEAKKGYQGELERHEASKRRHATLEQKLTAEFEAKLKVFATRYEEMKKQQVAEAPRVATVRITKASPKNPNRSSPKTVKDGAKKPPSPLFSRKNAESSRHQPPSRRHSLPESVECLNVDELDRGQLENEFQRLHQHLQRIVRENQELRYRAETKDLPPSQFAHKTAMEKAKTSACQKLNKMIHLLEKSSIGPSRAERRGTAPSFSDDASNMLLLSSLQKCPKKACSSDSMGAPDEEDLSTISDNTIWRLQSAHLLDVFEDNDPSAKGQKSVDLRRTHSGGDIYFVQQGNDFTASSRDNWPSQQSFLSIKSEGGENRAGKAPPQIKISAQSLDESAFEGDFADDDQGMNASKSIPDQFFFSDLEELMSKLKTDMNQLANSSPTKRNTRSVSSPAKRNARSIIPPVPRQVGNETKYPASKSPQIARASSARQFTSPGPQSSPVKQARPKSISAAGRSPQKTTPSSGKTAAAAQVLNARTEAVEKCVTKASPRSTRPTQPKITSNTRSPSGTVQNPDKKVSQSDSKNTPPKQTARINRFSRKWNRRPALSNTSAADQKVNTSK